MTRISAYSPRRHGRLVAGQRVRQRQALGLDPDRAALGHRIARIDHQVHQDLLQLPLVGPDRPKQWIMRQFQRDPLADQPVQQMRQIGQHVLQIERLRLQGLLARKGQQLIDQGRRAVGILSDLLQIGIIIVCPVVMQQQQDRNGPKSLSASC